MRVDGFSNELMDKLKTVRRSGLTFAPEAGTQRLRDVINKNVTEEELMKTVQTAFEGGWTTIKLYFYDWSSHRNNGGCGRHCSLGQQVVEAYYSNQSEQREEV